MNLQHCVLRPARVRDVVDNRGSIRVDAHGLFSVDDETDALPIVRPLIGVGGGIGGFTSPRVGMQVWVLNVTSNIEQLYWFVGDLSSCDDALSLRDDNDTCDVVLYRDDDGDNHAYGLYFTSNDKFVMLYDKRRIDVNDDGIRLTCNDTHTIDVHENDITMKSGDTHTFALSDNDAKITSSTNVLHVTDAGIALGASNLASHPAVLGDELVARLGELTNVLLQILPVLTAHDASPVVCAGANAGVIAGAISQVASTQAQIAKIISTRVTLE